VRAFVCHAPFSLTFPIALFEQTGESLEDCLNAENHMVQGVSIEVTRAATRPEGSRNKNKQLSRRDDQHGDYSSGRGFGDPYPPPTSNLGFPQGLPVPNPAASSTQAYLQGFLAAQQLLGQFPINPADGGFGMAGGDQGGHAGGGHDMRGGGGGGGGGVGHSGGGKKHNDSPR